MALKSYAELIFLGTDKKTGKVETQLVQRRSAVPSFVWLDHRGKHRRGSEEYVTGARPRRFDVRTLNGMSAATLGQICGGLRAC